MCVFFLLEGIERGGDIDAFIEGLGGRGGGARSGGGLAECVGRDKESASEGRGLARQGCDRKRSGPQRRVGG